MSTENKPTTYIVSFSDGGPKDFELYVKGDWRENGVTVRRLEGSEHDLYGQLPNTVQDPRLGSCFEFEIILPDDDDVAVVTRVRVPVEPIMKAAVEAVRTGRHSREDSVVVGRVVQPPVEEDANLEGRTDDEHEHKPDPYGLIEAER